MGSTILSYHSTTQLTEWGLRPENVYQTATYLKADCLSTGGEPYIFLYADGDVRAAIPFIRRTIPDTVETGSVLFDATSPYGYAGFICGRKDEQVYSQVLQSFNTLAATQDIVSCFLRLHPIAHAYSIPAAEGIKQVLHGKTVAIALQQPISAIRGAFSTNHKRDLKRLQKEGYTVQINAWEHYAAFRTAYTQTMQLRNARPQYFFDDRYFEQLRDPELHTHLFTSHAPDGTVASAALFFGYPGIAEYHLGGTLQAARDAAASKLIFDTAIPYFQEAGAAYLHIGGGYGSSDDSLFRFKSGFSSEHYTFSTIRMICDSDNYALLSNKKAQESGGKIQADYFPLYRS